MKLRNNEYVEYFDYKFKFINSEVICNICGYGKPCGLCKLFKGLNNSLCQYAVGIARATNSKFANLSRIYEIKE